MPELYNDYPTSKKKIQSRIWFFSLVVDENDIELIFENIKNSSVLNAFAILHDHDKIRLEDGSIIDKKRHYHLSLRFDNPTLISVVANLCNLDDRHYNLIQKAKNWRSACRYMLHLDQKEKYLYSIEKLIVLKGSKDDYYNVAIGKAQYITTDVDLFPDFGNFDKVSFKQQYVDIYNSIDEPKRRNLLIRELKLCYDNYLECKKYELQSKNINVLFIEGLPGSGKSAFAIYLCKKNNKSYCVSSSSNDILQDYGDEDVLILDDLRDDVLSFTDLLKLLDNHIISSVKSRYKNKVFLGDTIIITSSIPIRNWYLETEEDRKQLFRRINMYCKCWKNKTKLNVDIYNPLFGDSLLSDKGIPNFGEIFTLNFLDLDNKDDSIKFTVDYWSELGIDFNNKEMWKT